MQARGLVFVDQTLGYLGPVHLSRPARLASGVDPDRFTGFPETHQILLKNEHAQCISFYCVCYRFSRWHHRHAKFGGINRKIEPNERGGFAYSVSHRIGNMETSASCVKPMVTHQNFILMAKTSQAIKVNPSKLYFVGRAS